MTWENMNLYRLLSMEWIKLLVFLLIDLLPSYYRESIRKRFRNIINMEENHESQNKYGKFRFQSREH